MGRESRKKGKSGEYTAASLMMEHWDANFELTPSAEGTDGYLEWDDGIRLWVQIKTRRRRTKNTHCIPVRIDNPYTLSSWAAYGPILLVYIPEERRAWWMDTMEDLWPWVPRRTHTFEIPLNQPVDENTKQEVRRIALRRPRFLQPFVTPTPASLPIPLHPLRSPNELASISAETVKKIITDVYQEMHSVGVHERDVLALAVARLIHSQIRAFGQSALDAYLELVSNRLLSPHWGGRSFTLGALASLLQPQLSNPLDSCFIPVLSEASLLSVERKTFINPEFGLLITASLAQRFPNRGDLSELVEHLTIMVESSPQNIQVEGVAKTLRKWLENREVPFQTLFPPQWLEIQVVRPLPQDAEVFLSKDAAEEAVKEILQSGIQGATPHQLNLADQLIRLKANDRLSHWLGY